MKGSLGLQLPLWHQSQGDRWDTETTVVWCWVSLTGQWHLSSPTEKPLEERSEKVCRKAQQMAYYEGFRGGKCVLTACCLPREEHADQWAVSSRRGIKAAFRVQEQGKEGVLQCCGECFYGIRTVYYIMCTNLWVGVVLPAVQCFLRSC